MPSVKKAEAGKPIVWLRGDVKTPRTPRPVLDACKRRLREYDRLTGGEGQA